MVSTTKSLNNQIHRHIYNAPFIIDYNCTAIYLFSLFPLPSSPPEIFPYITFLESCGDK